jgi:putative FmdB family regulatory protein
MPTYVFKCNDCGAEEEVIATFSEFDKMKKGKLCHASDLCSGTMSTVIQSTSFALQGGGWAKDGYSKGKGR